MAQSLDLENIDDGVDFFEGAGPVYEYMAKGVRSLCGDWLEIAKEELDMDLLDDNPNIFINYEISRLFNSNSFRYGTS